MGVPKLLSHLLGPIVLGKGDNTLPPQKIKLPNKRVGKTKSPFPPNAFSSGLLHWVLNGKDEGRKLPGAPTNKAAPGGSFARGLGMAPWKMLPYMGMFASISALAQKCNDNNYLVGNNTSISDTKIKNKK